MSLGELCDTDVVTAAPDVRVAEVARLMRDQHVGSIVVTEDRKPVGIVTDRDLAIRVIASGLAIFGVEPATEM